VDDVTPRVPATPWQWTLNEPWSLLPRHAYRPGRWFLRGYEVLFTTMCRSLISITGFCTRVNLVDFSISQAGAYSMETRRLDGSSGQFVGET
jgi:hypothetical protein